jgi:hypothetical protein
MNSRPPDSSRSAYYPPRARWFSRLWYPWHHLRQISFLRQIPPCRDLSTTQFLAACLVPGYILRFYQYRRAAKAVTVGFFAALLLFILAYGYLAANLAFGLMISAHATSLALLLQRWFQPGQIRGRVMLSILSLLTVVAFIYLPLRAGMFGLFVPLDTGHGVVIFRHGPPPASVLRGQTIAFELNESDLNSAIVMLDGYGIEPVLALAGDRVEFSRDGFAINGILQPAMTNMPTRGEIVVPENYFFVWPRFAINAHNQSAEAVSARVLKTSMIARDQILGPPCQRWFGMRQPVP